jgi:hypothetical protein
MHEYIFVVRKMAWWWPHERSKYEAKIANREQERIKIQIVVLKGPLFHCFFLNLNSTWCSKSKLNWSIPLFSLCLGIRMNRFESSYWSWFRDSRLINCALKYFTKIVCYLAGQHIPQGYRNRLSVTVFLTRLHWILDRSSWIISTALLPVSCLTDPCRYDTYKVVQIWPGQTVTSLHTNRPGHIWNTLYVIPTYWWLPTCPREVPEERRPDRFSVYASVHKI